MERVSKIKRVLHHLDDIIERNLDYLGKSEVSPYAYYNNIRELSMIDFYWKIKEFEWSKGLTEDEIKNLVFPYMDSRYKKNDNG